MNWTHIKVRNTTDSQTFLFSSSAFINVFITLMRSAVHNETVISRQSCVPSARRMSNDGVSYFPTGGTMLHHKRRSAEGQLWWWALLVHLDVVTLLFWMTVCVCVYHRLFIAAEILQGRFVHPSWPCEHCCCSCCCCGRWRDGKWVVSAGWCILSKQHSRHHGDIH